MEAAITALPLQWCVLHCSETSRMALNLLISSDHLFYSPTMPMIRMEQVLKDAWGPNLQIWMLKKGSRIVRAVEGKYSADCGIKWQAPVCPLCRIDGGWRNWYQIASATMQYLGYVSIQQIRNPSIGQDLAPMRWKFWKCPHMCALHFWGTFPALYCANLLYIHFIPFLHISCAIQASHVLRVLPKFLTTCRQGASS